MSDTELDVKDDSGYKVSKKVTKEELLNMDQEDESLRRYKEQLLGATAGQGSGSAGSVQNIVVEAFEVHFPNKERNPYIFKLDTAYAIAKLKDLPFVLQEGCSYQFRLKFRVNKEIVSGLQWTCAVKRKGITVDRQQQMIGSYAPRPESQTYIFPSQTAPSGMLARGSYKGKAQFLDDDKNVYLKYDFKFDIKKGWS